MVKTDKLIELLSKHYSNNAEALVFCSGEEAFPSEYHKHLEGWPIPCDSFSVMPEYMDGSDISYCYSGKQEIEEWLRDNGFAAEDAARVMWANLAVLAQSYNQFAPEPKDNDHADYVIIYNRCCELTLMGGINWQLDAIKKAGLMTKADDYDFSAIVDPQTFRQMVTLDHFTQRITELVEELDLDLEEFLPDF